MDAITSYIDHMFRSLPKTEEVNQARRELLQMCEDRYTELRAEGASENEAVGGVITQFGNLDELADDLGIRREVNGITATDDALDVSRDEAERFLRVRRTGARMIALGIIVILLGVSQMIWFSDRFDTGVVAVVALVAFFVAIAAAVALFITGGMSMSRYDRYERHRLRLDPETARHYRELRESEHGRYTASIVTGVMLIILAFGAGAVGGMLGDEGGADGFQWLVSLMPLIIGIGVGVIIVGSMRRGSLDRLTSEGDFAPDKSKENDILGRIAGPYWMLALVVFLAWSFIGNAWDRSWIVWPIAGVLFGLVAVTAESVFGDRKTDEVVRRDRRG